MRALQLPLLESNQDLRAPEADTTTGTRQDPGVRSRQQMPVYGGFLPRGSRCEGGCRNNLRRAGCGARLLSPKASSCIPPCVVPVHFNVDWSSVVERERRGEMKAANQIDVGGTIGIRRLDPRECWGGRSHTGCLQPPPRKLQEFSAVVFALADDCSARTIYDEGRRRFKVPFERERVPSRCEISGRRDA